MTAAGRAGGGSERPVVATMRARDLCAAVGGRLVRGDGAALLGRVSTDTRSLAAGQLFVALRGERFDAHEFAAQALALGASGVVVERGRAPDAPNTPGFIVEVDDTLRALGDLAAAVIARRRALGDFIAYALTGSNGKTTTKELLACLLATRFRCLKTRGNLNNWVGLPLTALELTLRDEVAVFEMGANAPGEIARMVEIVQPDVALLTSVGPAHLEGFGGTLEAVARAKGEIFAESAERLVLPHDLLTRYPELAGDERVVTAGFDPAADVEVLSVEARDDGTQAQYRLPSGETRQVRIAVHGGHNAQNLALALAAVEDLELDAAVVQRALSELVLPGGRMEIRRYAGDIEVIQDAYNANPASMRAAFAVLGQRAVQPEHRLMVLGEMRELGAQSLELHRELGHAAAALAPRLLIAVGKDLAQAQAVADGALEAGLPPSSVRVLASEALSEIVEAVRSVLGAGDVVLLKGSRAVALERVAAALATESARAG